MLEIVSRDLRFVARFEEELAPQTVAALRGILPFDERIIHCRWSGESNWIPWGDRELGIGPENATSYPHPGELALYPGGQSETELLFPYGYCSFASKAGHLWANQLATLQQRFRVPSSLESAALIAESARLGALGEAAYLAFKGPRRVVPLFTSPAERAKVLAEAQQRLVGTVDAIARGEFPPTPDDVFRCETCSFATVCRKDYVGDV